MDHYHKFKFGVIGLELPKLVDKSQIVFDFFKGDRLVDSFWMSNGRVNHIFEYSEELEFIRVVTRTEDDGKYLGDIVLTKSFMEQWDLESRSEQWLPLSTEGGDFYAKDFNSFEMKSPCIMIRFDRIWTPPPSPDQIVHDELSIEKEIVREPYGFEEEPPKEDPIDEPPLIDYEEPEEQEPSTYVQPPIDYVPESQDYVPASQEYVQEPQESYPEPEDTVEPEVEEPIVNIEEPIIVQEPVPEPPKEETPPRPAPKKASLRRRDNPPNLPMQIPQPRAIM